MITLLKKILRARQAPALVRSVGFHYTQDAQAYQFRMPAGFVGDVNRTHPASIEPATMDPTNPPLVYGSPVVVDATSKRIRRLLATDTALTDIYGIVVRPFPVQQMQTTYFGQAIIGGDGPGLVNKVDVLRSGYVMVALSNFAAGPSAKGGAVFIWVAASAGNDFQNQFRAAASAGNTAAMGSAKTTFNGAPDAGGVVELAFNI